MKTGRIIFSVIIVGMICIGWINQLKFSSEKSAVFSAAVEEAEVCYDKKLYRKATIQYEEALKIKEDAEVRDELLKTYKLALEAEEVSDSDYVKAIENAVEIYPGRTDLWEMLITMSIGKLDYKGAKKYYEDAIESADDKDAIKKYRNDIFYAVAEHNRIFTKVLMSSQGYFTVSDGEKWGVIDPKGEWVFENIYSYVGPVINKDTYLLTSEKDTRVYNNANVAQYIIDSTDIRSKVISEGIIPYQYTGNFVWYLYDYVNDKFILDKCEEVSGFNGGKVAVKKDGKWSILNKEGEKVSDEKFDDIKMLENGEYAPKGTMIASVGGKYGMFDASGKRKNDFEAADMDICLGGAIAYKDSKGKWGFVNSDGKIVIEPEYEGAMSFSNGLAAVCKDSKWGFIEESGELVIDYTYCDGGYFNSNGVCFVGLLEDQKYMISLRLKGGK